MRRFCPSLGDVWHVDEVFVKCRGGRHYLWQTVDQDGDLIDILVQRNRDSRAATRFIRRLLKGQESEPWRFVTDKLKSSGSAHRRIVPSVTNDTDRESVGPIVAWRTESQQYDYADFVAVVTRRRCDCNDSDTLVHNR